MAVDASLDAGIRELEDRLARRVDSHPPLTFTPAWWQERLLEWATNDPDFRVKLLRFVDVLPTLRDARSVADHVRQYFRGSSRPLVDTATGLAAQPVFRPVLSRVVREGVFAMANRFIAGATPKEAIPSLRELAKKGIAYTVDLLGEETLSNYEADVYLERYKELIVTLCAHLEEIRPRGDVWDGVPPVNISIKLSALCPHLEPAAPEFVSEVSRARLRPLLRVARERGAFINFDMEQYRYKHLVQRTFADLLLEPEFAHYEHVGIVVQAYLRDAEEDIASLCALAKRRASAITVRLVKGAYWDEERIVAAQNSWSVPVFARKADTDASFDRCTDLLLESWPHLRPAFGTHNPHSVAQAVVKSRAAGIPDSGIEFQMLYGMAEGLRSAVHDLGLRTRVYVPIGRIIPGMAYLVRRLLENTSNQAWFNVGLSRKKDAGTTVEGKPAATDYGGFRNCPPAPFFEAAARERMGRALDAVRRAFGASYPLLVGDREVTDRGWAEVRYPAQPDAVIGRVAQATGVDVEEAVAAARRSYTGWRDRPARERGDILRRAADLMEERRYELAATMVFESAKPWHEADGDVAEAVDYLRYYAAEAERLEEPRLLVAVPGEINEYFYQGRGVAAIIAPWNFPLAIICGMSVGALAGGNAAILKPAAPSPIIAFKLVQLLREAGVPPEVVQYLPGSGAEIGRALVEHPGVDIIAFTGSNAVGLGIIEAAARVRPGQRNIKRVIAELGGKNAIIIDDDADLDQAVSGLLTAAFGYAGQKCSACSRLIVVDSAYDEAVERLRHAVQSLVVGPPHEPATFVPPVISAAAREKILGYIEGGMRYAKLLTQGSAPSGGHYVPPTVFTDVPLEAPLACEEVFGPVLAVFRAVDFEGALDIAMSSNYALSGGVFSRNPRHIEAAKRRFGVGNLYINRKITGAVVGRQPFGGLRMSGVGEKAGGPDYVRQFMEPRVVTENTMRRGFAPEA